MKGYNKLKGFHRHFSIYKLEETKSLLLEIQKEMPS
jgi:hypothetical protein